MQVVGYKQHFRLSTFENLHAGTFKRRVTCGSSQRLIVVYTKSDCPLCDGLKVKQINFI